MNRLEQSAAAVYRRLLRFYPPAFRAAFADEMQEVFAQQLAEAAGKGSVHLALACLRELKDYPLNLIREYWVAIKNKEVVMAASGSASIGVGVCPRCGDLRPAEARYCPNCGRAFIPLGVLVVEQIRNFLNSRITLVVFAGIALLAASTNAEWQIVYELFYPRSYTYMAVGIGAAGLLTGWVLVRVGSNAVRLGLTLFSLVAVMLFYSWVETLDNAALRSEIQAGRALSYRSLGLTTRLERLEPGAAVPDFPLFRFNLPVCEEGNAWVCLQSFEWVVEDAAGAPIAVERAWKLPMVTYRLLILVYILAMARLGVWVSRRLKSKPSAAKSP